MGAEPRGGDQGMGLEGRVMSPTTRLYGRGCRGPERDTTGSRSHSKSLKLNVGGKWRCPSSYGLAGSPSSALWALWSWSPSSSARSTRTSHLVTPSLSFLDVAARPEWCLSGPSLRTALPLGGDR